MKRILFVLLMLAAFAPAAKAQTGATQLDGGTLAQRPATCKVSRRQVYFQTDSAGDGPGAYECAPIDNAWRRVGVTSHGALTGLSADDHPQYFNQSRGDARYSQLGHAHVIADTTGLQAALDSKASASHSHAESDVTGLVSDLASKASAAALSAHLADTNNPHSVTKAQVGLGAVTNDAQLKIASNLSDLNNPATARTNLGLGTAATQASSAFAAASHTHAESDITGLVTDLAGKQNALGYTPLNAANNLSDVSNAAAARSNIGAGTGNGSVTSVGLSVPGVLFSVSGSPVTTSGSFSFSLLNQSANTVFAGPTTGAAAAPTFRALVAADIPTLTSAKLSDFASAASAAAPVQSVNGATGAVSLTLPATTTSTASQFFTAYNATTGGFTKAQAAFSDLTGTAATGQIPDLSATYPLLAGKAGGQTINGGTAASENITIQSTSNSTKGYILLGTGGLVGVNKSAPGAQLHVVAKDASTKGLIVQMAASPSASPFEVQDSTGASKFSIDQFGNVTMSPVNITIGVGAQYGNGTISLYNGGGVYWTSGSYNATKDLSLTRSAAGVIQAGDGGANANGTLKAARFQFSATVTPASSADSQGNTGDVRYDDNYLYVKTSAGWKRLALSTF